jgi:O-antigen/teichoic acid export membrane protein
MIKIWHYFVSYIKKSKDLSFIGIANVAGAITFSIFWLFIASLIGTEGYGNIGYLLSTGAIASTFALLGSPDMLVVYRAKEVRLESTIFLIVIISTVVSALITFFIVNSIEISLYIFGFVMFSLVLHEKLGSRDYRKYSIYYLSQRMSSIVLSLILYYIIGINGIILGYAISFLPFCIMIYRILKNTPLNFSLVSTRAGFLITSYAKTIFHALYLNVDKLIILPLFGAVQLGHYYLGFQVFNAMLLLSTTVFQFTIPEDSSGMMHTKLKKYTVIFSILISLFGIFLTPFLVPIFLTEFTESIPIIQIMSIAVVPYSISLMYTSKFLGDEKIKIVIIGKILSVMSLIIGIVVLGNFYGIIGVAISFTLSSIIMMVYFYITQKIK